MTLVRGLWSWGRNQDGQLGDGSNTARFSPMFIPVPGRALWAQSEWDFGCALDPDGSVWTWGLNRYGELGNGTETPRAKPARVPGLTSVVGITVTSHSVYAVKTDGTVWLWGSNPGGNWRTDDQRFLRPTRVQGLSNVVAVSEEIGAALALRADGSVWAWGKDSEYGEFGVSTDREFRPVPKPVPGIDDVTILVREDFTVYALRSDGTVWAWGKNGTGFSGDGVTKDRHFPAPVPGLDSVIGLSASQTVGGAPGAPAVAVFALKADGTVWSWGVNSRGRLGDGTKENRSAPVRVTGLDKVTSIVAVYDTTYALREDGTVWAWGQNKYGGLGDGTTKNRKVPAQVPGLTSIRSIHRNTMVNGSVAAVRSDGTLWTVGTRWGVGLAEERTDEPGHAFQVPGLSSVTNVVGEGPIYVHAEGIRTPVGREPKAPRPEPDSIWQTWKPYAGIAAAIAAAVWWYQTQSSFVSLKDGEYQCIGVFVNASGKHEVLRDASGRTLQATATVRDDEVVALRAVEDVSAGDLADLTIKRSGDSRFEATMDPAPHSYEALSCEHS